MEKKMTAFQVNFEQCLVGVIPVYTLPVENVGHVAIEMRIYSGACDDREAGVAGLHHWAEHIPFRGTEKFPDGSEQILSMFESIGGRINASTSHYSTTYEAVVPNAYYEQAIDLLVDMAFYPLLRSEDVEAERIIIHAEIARAAASPGRTRRRSMDEIMFEGHPREQSVLGTDETLALANADNIRELFANSYARSRVIFSISGGISSDDMCEGVRKVYERIPHRSNISVRRASASYGHAPMGEAGREYELSVGFPGSEVHISVPLDSALFSPMEVGFAAWILGRGPNSPLFQEVRGKRNLVYEIGARSSCGPDQLIFEMSAPIKEGTAREVLDAIWEAIDLDEETLLSRFELVKKNALAPADMRIISPSNFVSYVTDDLHILGEYRSEKRDLELVNELQFRAVQGVLEEIKRENSRTFIFSD